MKSSTNHVLLSTLLFLISTAVAQQLENESEVQTTAGTDDEDGMVNLEDEKDSTRYIMEILGTVGGTLIALSLAPQVFKTYKTRSALDISYTYQAIYIAGLSLVNLYAIIEGLWPVYFPALIELSMIVALTVMKVVYDREKIKEAAQRALSRSWQSAKSFSASSRNVMLNVSRHSVALNLSRHGRGGGDGDRSNNGNTGVRNSGGDSRKNPMGFTAKDWKDLNDMVDKDEEQVDDPDKTERHSNGIHSGSQNGPGNVEVNLPETDAACIVKT